MLVHNRPASRHFLHNNFKLFPPITSVTCVPGCYIWQQHKGATCTCVPATQTKIPQSWSSADQSKSHSSLPTAAQPGLMVNRLQTSSQGALGVVGALHLYMGHSPRVGIGWSATYWSEGDGDPVSRKEGGGVSEGNT